MVWYLHMDVRVKPPDDSDNRQADSESPQGLRREVLDAKILDGTGVNMSGCSRNAVNGAAWFQGSTVLYESVPLSCVLRDPIAG